jgi:hypothetical protein
VNARPDELLETAVNAYEDAMRKVCDWQRGLGHTLAFEPARSILETTADLTRDVAAVQLSGMRWLLDT